MPRYVFINKKTEEQEVHYLKISELEDFKKTNEHLKQELCTPMTCDPVLVGVKKTSPEFNDLLNRMKKNTPNSTVKAR